MSVWLLNSDIKKPSNDPPSAGNAEKDKEGQSTKIECKEETQGATLALSW